MKTGILTFHYVNNYGAILQAVALQQTLKDMGHEVVFVNYIPELDTALSHPRSSFSIRCKRLISKWITHFRFFRYRRDLRSISGVFERFRKKTIVETRRYVGNEALRDDLPDVDAFVVGSDQVWRRPFIPVYFLDFLGKSTVRRIAYAASTDCVVVPEEEKDRMRTLLKNFDRISTREQEFTTNINEFSEKKSVTLVDPVFLQAASFWRQYTRTPLIAGDYILVYVMKPRKNFIAVVRECQRRLKMPIVVLVANGALVHTLGIPYDRIIVDADPSQFVNLVANAKFMCTSAFHGTAFALIMHTPFLSYTFDPHDERMRHILKATGMERFHVSNVSDVGAVEPSSYDFDRSDRAIDAMAVSGRDFLREALS